MRAARSLSARARARVRTGVARSRLATLVAVLAGGLAPRAIP